MEIKFLRIIYVMICNILHNKDRSLLNYIHKKYIFKSTTETTSKRRHPESLLQLYQLEKNAERT